MRIGPLLLLAPAGLLLASAAAAAAHEPLVDNLRYRAGGPPGWSIEIGDDIAFRRGPHFFDGSTAVVSLFPYRPARVRGGVGRWRSSSGRSAILIEARPGPCVSPGGASYEDHIRVVARGHDLAGCGGRLIAAASN